MRRRRPHYIGLQFSVVLAATLVALVTLVPMPALADAPDTRGPRNIPRGGVSSGDLAGQTLPTPREMLSQAQGRTSAPIVNAPMQPAPIVNAPMQPAPAQQTSGILSWITLPLNPGRWAMESGLGMMATSLSSITGSVLQSAMSLVVVPTGGDTWVEEQMGVEAAGKDESCLGVVFCTPTSLFYLNGGVRGENGMATSLGTIWQRLRPVTQVLFTILLIIRITMIIMEPSSFRDDFWSLILTIGMASTIIRDPGYFMRVIVGVFNALTRTALGEFADPMVWFNLMTPNFELMTFGLASFQFAAMIVFVCLLVAGLIRMFKIFVLSALVPVMAALLLWRSTGRYFWSWLSVIVSLLIEQTVWAVAFAIGLAIAVPGGNVPTLATAQDVATVSSFLAGVTIAGVMALISKSAFESVFSTAHVSLGGQRMRGMVKTAATVIGARKVMQMMRQRPSSASNTPSTDRKQQGTSDAGASSAGTSNTPAVRRPNLAQRVGRAVSPAAHKAAAARRAAAANQAPAAHAQVLFDEWRAQNPDDPRAKPLSPAKQRQVLDQAKKRRDRGVVQRPHAEIKADLNKVIAAAPLPPGTTPDAPVDGVISSRMRDAMPVVPHGIKAKDIPQWRKDQAAGPFDGAVHPVAKKVAAGAAKVAGAAKQVQGNGQAAQAAQAAQSQNGTPAQTPRGARVYNHPGARPNVQGQAQQPPRPAAQQRTPAVPTNGVPVASVGSASPPPAVGRRPRPPFVTHAGSSNVPPVPAAGVVPARVAPTPPRHASPPASTPPAQAAPMMPKRRAVRRLPAPVAELWLMTPSRARRQQLSRPARTYTYEVAQNHMASSERHAQAAQRHLGTAAQLEADGEHVRAQRRRNLATEHQRQAIVRRQRAEDAQSQFDARQRAADDAKDS